jgi:hypothetical protein
MLDVSFSYVLQKTADAHVHTHVHIFLHAHTTCLRTLRDDCTGYDLPIASASSYGSAAMDR